MHVESFDSIDDMFEAMRNKQKEANDNLNGAQRELRDDFEHTRYWVRNSSEGFLLFGVAWSTNDCRDRSAATLPPGLVKLDSWDLFEVLSELEMMAPNRMAGYIRGEVFSIACPTGELGDTHAVSVMPISREAFEEARTAEWQLDSNITPTLINECLEIEAYIRQVRNGAAE